MKNSIKNCLATTALALILLSIIATLYQGHYLCIETVFQVFLVSIIIHLVLYFLKLFESKYFMVEILIEIGTTIIILIVSGYIFHWYDSLPGWVLALMGVVVYVAGCLIDIFHINRDLKLINQQLKNRKHSY